MDYLCFDDFSSGLTEDLTFSASSLNCCSGRLRESVSLYGNILRGKFSISNNNLVDTKLGLGNCLCFKKAIVYERGNGKKRCERVSSTKNEGFDEF
jgi:hypothetical protein